MTCHYCGWSILPPTECPECGSLDTGYAGFGTEFIESEVRNKFPSARIDRIDTDSLSGSNDLQVKINQFRNGETDILLGTQMVAKGLNFPTLKLVGVVLADTGLHLPDFRAAERTFSLITQVAGRAGRFFPDGKVLVQTYNPEREAISCACSGDITGFYEKELEQRRILNFPPFSRMIRLVFRSAQEKAARQAADDAAPILTNSAGSAEILGPSECPLAMIAANYRFQILIRAQTVQCAQHICTQLLASWKPPHSVYLEVDVDPVSLL
jgi:primosomal protein N' (replication factor Y)